LISIGIFQVTVAWIDYQTMSLRKQLPCGKDLSYKLVAGPGGFARAQVGTEFEETDCPNLLLVVRKRPAGARKKPAAAKKEEEEDDEYEEPSPAPPDHDGEAQEEEEKEDEIEECEDKEEAAEPPLKTYLKMWYKNSLNFGVRQKFGAKSQIFCLGGKKVKMSKEELATIADEAITAMENGSMSEDQACAAAKAKVV
jgi:hypothetical protein